MDYRHISVSLVDGVTVVRFKNLDWDVHSEDRSMKLATSFKRCWISFSHAP